MDSVNNEEARNGLHTYAEPLSGLRVSWGAILAGVVATLSVALILMSLAMAIILSTSHATNGSVRTALIASSIAAIVTTLIGAFLGGWFAGYLPGNRNRAVAAAHAFLAWGVAFLLATSMQVSAIGGLARETTDATLSTGAAAAQLAGSAVANGQVPLDARARNLLKSLGYSDTEANQIVGQSKAEVQHTIRGQQGPTREDLQGAVGKAVSWSAGLTWTWFGTWLLSGLLAIAGGLLAARKLSSGRSPDLRDMRTPSEPITPVTPVTPATV